MTINIANPSAARAERQLEWLAGRSEQVFVFTETSPGPGTQLLLSRLGGAGWDVREQPMGPEERGVAIASRIRCDRPTSDIVGFLPARAELITVGGLDIVGLYVPSRDESANKADRKFQFCQAVSTFLAERGDRDAVILGDLNVLEPIHRPHYALFRDWEYRFYDEFVVRGFLDAYRLKHPTAVEHSWVDYEGHGYRFDHLFVSNAIAPRTVRCEFDHAPREAGLSDHSALAIELDWDATLQELETNHALTGEQPALF